MDDRPKRRAAVRRLPDRRRELWAEIERLAERVAHLEAQARRVEAGQADERRRFDEAGRLLGREETVKFQPSAAVGYWKELREQEARLDAKRERLRELEASGLGRALHVVVRHEKPPLGA